MQYIFCKIQIIVGKSTSYIIIGLISALSYFLELGNDQIIAALTASERTHLIMHFLTAIDTQNNIGHFLVGKLQDIII